MAPRTTDPHLLLKSYEKQSLARLRNAGQELTQQPGRRAPNLLDVVRRHPKTSLAVSAGVGFLLAPGKKRSEDTSRREANVELKKSAAQFTKAGKMVLYTRLFQALLGPQAGATSNAEAGAAGSEAL